MRTEENNKLEEFIEKYGAFELDEEYNRFKADLSSLIKAGTEIKYPTDEEIDKYNGYRKEGDLHFGVEKGIEWAIDRIKELNAGIVIPEKKICHEELIGIICDWLKIPHSEKAIAEHSVIELADKIYPYISNSIPDTEKKSRIQGNVGRT